MPAKKTPKIAEAVWTQLKGLYGSGLFESTEALHRHGSSLFKKMPSLPVLRRRATAEHWSKTAYMDRIEAAQEKTFKDQFKAIGFDAQAAAQKVKSGIDAGDLKEALAYLQEFFKLTGAYPAVKIRGINRGVAGFDDEMSMDELLAERARLKNLLDADNDRS